MSDNIEHRLRAGRNRLPQPDREATERARQTVLAAPIFASHRLRRRRLVAAVAAAGLAVAAAFGAGFAFASSRGQAERIRTVEQSAEGPGFLPAAGWNVLQTGATVPPQAPVATAANVPLDPADSAQGFPFHTVAKLPENGVVLTALFMSPVSDSDIAGFARRFPPATLPLRLADAEQSGPIEGQSLDEPGPRVLLAGVDGYAIQVDVFFGSASPPDVVVARSWRGSWYRSVPQVPSRSQPRSSRARRQARKHSCTTGLRVTTTRAAPRIWSEQRSGPGSRQRRHTVVSSRMPAAPHVGGRRSRSM